MRLSGDQLGPDQFVTVNSKPVLVDIKELDTTEGWVDVFLPNLPTAAQEGNVDDLDDDIPIFDFDVRRLEGEVKIVTME